MKTYNLRASSHSSYRGRSGRGSSISDVDYNKIVYKYFSDSSSARNDHDFSSSSESYYFESDNEELVRKIKTLAPDEADEYFKPIIIDLYERGYIDHNKFYSDQLNDFLLQVEEKILASKLKYFDPFKKKCTGFKTQSDQFHPIWANVIYNLMEPNGYYVSVCVERDYTKQRSGSRMAGERIPTKFTIKVSAKSEHDDWDASVQSFQTSLDFFDEDLSKAILNAMELNETKQSYFEKIHSLFPSLKPEKENNRLIIPNSLTVNVASEKFSIWEISHDIYEEGNYDSKSIRPGIIDTSTDGLNYGRVFDNFEHLIEFLSTLNFAQFEQHSSKIEQIKANDEERFIKKLKLLEQLNLPEFPDFKVINKGNPDLTYVDEFKFQIEVNHNFKGYEHNIWKEELLKLSDEEVVAKACKWIYDVADDLETNMSMYDGLESAKASVVSSIVFYKDNESDLQNALGWSHFADYKTRDYLEFRRNASLHIIRNSSSIELTKLKKKSFAQIKVLKNKISKCHEMLDSIKQELAPLYDFVNSEKTKPIRSPRFRAVGREIEELKSKRDDTRSYLSHCKGLREILFQQIDRINKIIE